MKLLLPACISCIFLLSCEKDSSPLSLTSEARYKVIFTGLWTTPAFSVPPNAHYTTIVGLVHNEKTDMWKEGKPATPGAEFIAEDGNGTLALTEIDAKIAEGNASSLILFVGSPLTGASTTSIYLNNNYSRVSLMSMLGPTPDWFTGIDSYNLYSGGKWISDTTINLYAYDAGTEEGDLFGMNNPATNPQQVIKRLSPATASALANGNSTLGPIATIRFTRQ